VLLNPVFRIPSRDERHENEWFIVKDVGPEELQDVRVSELGPRLLTNMNILGVEVGRIGRLLTLISFRMAYEGWGENEWSDHDEIVRKTHRLVGANVLLILHHFDSNLHLLPRAPIDLRAARVTTSLREEDVLHLQSTSPKQSAQLHIIHADHPFR